MDIKITYYVHGTTTDNENNVCTGWNHGILSELGVKQSQGLRSLVSEKQFDLVYCSDLKRAIDSAEICFSGICRVIHDSRLREANYGDLNGAPEYRFNENHTAYIENPFPNGECYKDVEKRMAAGLGVLCMKGSA